MTSVNKPTTSLTDTESVISYFKTTQKQNLKDISKVMISETNLVKITLGNPKELDLHVLDGFIRKTAKKTKAKRRVSRRARLLSNLNNEDSYGSGKTTLSRIDKARKDVKNGR
jgi:hypothetical protein